MKQTVQTGLKLTIAFILFMSFAAVVLVSTALVYRPSAVIELLQQLQPKPTQAPFALKGVGIIGDSQSDEYRADDSRGSTYASTTMNWVELLAKYRSVNFGDWGVWEEPRRTGYSYNWARSGATANSMILSGQAAGIAEQVREGKVNQVIIYIGANDFAPYITDDGYQAIYDGTITRANLIRKENLIVSNIKTAIDTIRDSGDARILLITIPDWGNHIGIQVGFPFPDQRTLVSTAIKETNIQIENLGKRYTIPTIDPNDFYKSINERNGSSGITVGDQVLTRILPSDDPHSLVLDDGVHPGTVMNGLFANFIISALNTSVGTSIKPFSTAEVLSAAGL